MAAVIVPFPLPAALVVLPGMPQSSWPWTVKTSHLQVPGGHTMGCELRCHAEQGGFCPLCFLVVIAYGEQCRIPHLQRRFSFGTRDQT